MKKEKIKEGYEPWPETIEKDFKHTILEAEIAKDSKDSEVMMYEMGLEKVEEEVQASIDQAKTALHAAEIKLAALQYDKLNKSTQKRLYFKLEEAKRESARHKQNIDALKHQLEEGRPIAKSEPSKKVPDGQA